MDRLFILAEYQAGRELEKIFLTMIEDFLEKKIRSEERRKVILKVIKGALVILEAAMLYRQRSTFREYLMGLQRNKADVRGFLCFHLIIKPLLYKLSKLFLGKYEKYNYWMEWMFNGAFLLFKTPISMEHMLSGSTELVIRQQYFKQGSTVLQYVYYLLWPTAATGMIHGFLQWTESAPREETNNEWHQLRLNSSPKVQAPVEKRGKCPCCSKTLQSRAYLPPSALAYCSLECIPKALSSKYITLHL